MYLSHDICVLDKNRKFELLQRSYKSDNFMLYSKMILLTYNNWYFLGTLINLKDTKINILRNLSSIILLIHFQK